MTRDAMKGFFGPGDYAMPGRGNPVYFCRTAREWFDTLAWRLEDDAGRSGVNNSYSKFERAVELGIMEDRLNRALFKGLGTWKPDPRKLEDWNT